jgi:hypothetical protein
MARTFHTFGDSHGSRHGSWPQIRIPNITINASTFTPGKLMFSFGRDKVQVCAAVADGDMVCFCYGETDCRMHVNKYKNNWKANIENNVEAYFHNIEANIKNKNVTTFVYNVVPTYEPLHAHKNGTAEDILKYTLYMNEKIKEKCDEYGYVFFDVYDKYSDERGYLIPEYSDKICHIKNSIFLTEFLQEFLQNEK